MQHFQKNHENVLVMANYAKNCAGTICQSLRSTSVGRTRIFFPSVLVSLTDKYTSLLFANFFCNINTGQRLHHLLCKDP